ncbi:MAG: hypothetical protein HOP13_02720 [Alphaproteobacteria bacterium]|nr:hypothetical protein [Alphaproteobacteria bacterium]
MADAAAPTAIANPYDGLTPEGEAAIAAFDRAFQPFDPDQSLLTGTPARSLSESMDALVVAMTHLDIDRVARRNGWWHRFTGADLEVRLELEVAAHRFDADMARLAQAAADGRRALNGMKGDIERLAAIAPAHEALAEQTIRFLRGANAQVPNVARLQRRAANLETVIASNRLASAQMAIATDCLSGLLDRYNDIEKRLFPVWRHHALAVAQSVGNADDSLEQIRTIRKRLATTGETSEKKAS